MTRLLTLLLLFPLLLRAADPTLVDGTRIIQIGASNTGAMRWNHYIASYLILRNPTLTLHIQTEARSATSPTSWIDGSTYEYYGRRAHGYEPDIIMSQFGTSGSDVVVWEADYRTIVTAYYVGRSSATPILIGPFPWADSSGGSTSGERTPILLDIGSDLSVSVTDHWTTPMHDVFASNEVFTADSGTDVLTSTAHTRTDGMRIRVRGGTLPSPLAINTDYYARDITANTFKVAATAGGAAIDLTTAGSGTLRHSRNWALAGGADQEHPGPAAYIVFARQMVDQLGWSTAVSQAVINGSAGTLTSDTNCTVSGLSINSYGGVDFSRLDERLPWAIDAGYLSDAIELDASVSGFQDYSLTVSGLSAGTYDVLINGDVVASVTHTALAAGWNMSELTSGPVYEKQQEVLGRIRDMHFLNRTTLVEKTSTTADPRAGCNLYRYYGDIAYGAGLRTTDFINDAGVQRALHRTLGTVTVDTGTDFLTRSSHGYSNTGPVRFSSTGTLPTGISADTTYYVANKTTNTFQIAATSGGAAIDISGSPTGTLSVYQNVSVDDMDELINQAAQPETLTFSLRLQGFTVGGGGGAVNAGTHNTTTLNVGP